MRRHSHAPPSGLGRRAVCVGVALMVMGGGLSPRSASATPAIGLYRARPPAVVAPAPPAGAVAAPAPAHTTTPAAPSASPGAAPMGDPLADNGLSSPLCRSSRLASGLSPLAQANCASSGLAVSPAPVTHYGFDVHIDSGWTASLNRSALSIVQEVVLTPVWTALVWLVQGTLVVLEWCYSLDLLDGGALGPVSVALRSAQSTFTQPWLVALLAVAAVGVAYRGLIRRRVSDTLAESLTMLAMIAGGLWLMVNPIGGVGEVNRLANQASLGTLAAFSSGDPGGAERKFSGGLHGIFSAIVQAPWCYLEFGDVAWCREPGRLDLRLRATARAIAAGAKEADTCRAAPGAGLAICAAPGSQARAGLRQEWQLVDRARSNADLFLAFPDNTPARNSIHSDRSLLRTLCGSEDLGACRGPTAAQAQFRDVGGTWPRAGGLLFIAIGVAGMLALLGFIALRLLGAAVLALVYLLLAPVLVLAPTLGQTGRDAFRAWAGRLLGAILAKLIYSALLGVVLLVASIMEGLGSLGWWTQWILLAAFWWIVFEHRQKVLEYATLGHRETAEHGMRLAGGLVAARQLGRMAGLPVRLAERVWNPPTRPPAPEPKPPGPSHPKDPPPDSPQGQAQARLQEQADHVLARRHQAAFEHAQATTTVRSGIAGTRRRAQTLRDQARRTADPRVRVRSQQRADDLEAKAHRQELSLGRDRRLAERGEELRLTTGLVHDTRQRNQTAELLDGQMKLRRGAAPVGDGAGTYRDYGAIAGLVGLSAQDYEGLGPHEQRQMRVSIDRQLDERARAQKLLAPSESAPRMPLRGQANGGPGPLTTWPTTARPSSGVRSEPSVAGRRQRQFSHARSDRPARARSHPPHPAVDPPPVRRGLRGSRSAPGSPPDRP